MSDTEPPPPDAAPPSSPSSRPSSAPDKESRRRRLEGVIPEIIKRAVEIGVEKARESPDSLKQFVGDLKVPKEIAHYIFSQIDETKNGLFRVVAKEMRDFLEHTNFAGEMQKILTTVQFEVNTTIRFRPNDGRPNEGRSEAPPKKTDRPVEDDDGDEMSDDDGEPGEKTDEGILQSLPRPEVKTAVHVRRDETRREERKRRSPRDT